MLTRPATLPDYLSPIWEEMAPGFHDRIGPAGLESVCIQVHRMRDAQKRISAEGLIVADAKGNPCPHPALAIERQAQGEIKSWVERFGVVPAAPAETPRKRGR